MSLPIEDTLDMIASFAIFVIEGFILIINNTDDIMKHLKHLERFSKKILDKWNISHEKSILIGHESNNKNI